MGVVKIDLFCFEINIGPFEVAIEVELLLVKWSEEDLCWDVGYVFDREFYFFKGLDVIQAKIDVWSMESDRWLFEVCCNIELEDLSVFYLYDVRGLLILPWQLRRNPCLHNLLFSFLQSILLHIQLDLQIIMRLTVLIYIKRAHTLR